MLDTCEAVTGENPSLEGSVIVLKAMLATVESRDRLRIIQT